MIKISITEDSPGGKTTVPREIAEETSNHVHSIEVRAMLATITSKAFQEEVKALLRAICRKHHIPLVDVPGL